VTQHTLTQFTQTSGYVLHEKKNITCVHTAYCGKVIHNTNQFFHVMCDIYIYIYIYATLYIPVFSVGGKLFSNAIKY